MKAKDIYEDYEPKQLILYAEKDDGTYGPIQTGSHLSKNYLDDYWFKLTNLEKQLSVQLANNEISPVYYYMMLMEMSEAELAARVSLSKYRVKKHFKPENFSKIKLSVLFRYAEVFGVPVANIFQLIQYQENEEMKSFYIKDKEPGYFCIKQSKTKNPFSVLTEIKNK